MYIRKERITGDLHRRIFILPAFEYENDWGDIYLNIYFLGSKIIIRFKP